MGDTDLETEVKRLYEGMFLVDSGLAASDWDGVIASVETVLSRADAETVSLHKWDERSLAYAVVGKGRGTYILTYFHADPGRISGIERDVQLSESLMRVLVLRTDKMGHGDIDKKTPAQKVAEAIAAAAAAAELKAKSEAAAESEVKEEAPADEAKEVESAPVVSEQPQESPVEVAEPETSQSPDSAESPDESGQ
jgi:small subunit ribosomal protein S6